MPEYSGAFADRGPLVEAFEELRRLLSSCPAWQQWRGVQDDASPAAASAEGVHLIALPPPTGRDIATGDGAYTRAHLESLRPFALIDYPPPEMEDDESFVGTRHASGYFVHRGRLNLAFDADVPAELRGDLQGAKLDFMRKVGAVIRDLEDRADTDDFLSVLSLRMWAPPLASDELGAASMGEFFKAEYLVDYGVRG